MENLRKIAEDKINDIINSEPSYLDDGVYFYEVDEEVYLEDDTFLTIQGKAEQKIKKIYPRTYEDEGCIDCYEPTGEFVCELFNENGIINTFNIEL